jgi:hypothetical protein
VPVPKARKSGASAFPPRIARQTTRPNFPARPTEHASFNPSGRFRGSESHSFATTNRFFNKTAKLLILVAGSAQQLFQRFTQETVYKKTGFLIAGGDINSLVPKLFTQRTVED